MTGTRKWEVAGAPLANTHAQQWRQVAFPVEKLVHATIVEVSHNTMAPLLVEPVVRQIASETGYLFARWDSLDLMWR